MPHLPRIIVMFIPRGQSFYSLILPARIVLCYSIIYWVFIMAIYIYIYIYIYICSQDKCSQAEIELQSTRKKLEELRYDFTLYYGHCF